MILAFIVFSCQPKEKKKGSQIQELAAVSQIMPIANLPEGEIEVRILMDRSSIEVFINKGQYVMTAQLFPNEAYSKLVFKNISDQEISLGTVTIDKIESVW